MKPIALLIEDDPGVATVYRLSLEKLEMEVKWSESLAGGIRMCKEIPPPKLIILDLRLTDSNDQNTIHQIATLQNLAPESLILVVSGFITPALAQLAIENGAHGVYEKLKVQRMEDFWTGIEQALSRAPSKQQDALSYTNNLIHQLLTTLHLPTHIPTYND